MIPKVGKLERIFWIAALAVAIGFGVSQAATQTATVRITARVNEDNGKVEFGLQELLDENIGGARWGERILPSSRFFPGDAQPGRWLNSSRIQLDVEVVRSISECVWAQYSAATTTVHQFVDCHDTTMGRVFENFEGVEWDAQVVLDQEGLIDWFAGCSPMNPRAAVGEGSQHQWGPSYVALGSWSEGYFDGADYVRIWIDSNDHSEFAVTSSLGESGYSSLLKFACLVTP